MKKLFLTALSAAMLFGVASCGTSYSDEVKKAGKNSAGQQINIYLMGQWTNPGGNWLAKENFMLTETSVKAVSEFSKDIADQLAKKELDYLYVIETTINEGAGWSVGYYKADGTYAEVDGNFAFKAAEGYYNADEQIHVAENWIPNPADTGARKADALSSNVFVPPYNAEKDEHQMDWNSNLVLLDGAGTYKVVVAKYTTQSTRTVSGYGVGAVKIS